MRIHRVGTTPSSKGPSDQFTGAVRRDVLMQAEMPGRVSTGMVTFEPGARTAWHTHPAGQILIVVAGRGWVQCEGEPRADVYPGDAVWFPADVRHWHGATSTTAMTHIAVTERVKDAVVAWLELVTEAEYSGDQ